jgi:hypothetical protein
MNGRVRRTFHSLVLVGSIFYFLFPLSAVIHSHSLLHHLTSMKIPPKSLYYPKDPESSYPPTWSDGKAKNNGLKDPESGTEQEEDKLSQYDIENTLEKSDYEDRKWLLFQLVLCNPIFLEEVMLGFPMSLVVDDDVIKGKLADGNDVVGDDSSGNIEVERLSENEQLGRICVLGDIPQEEDLSLEMTDLSLKAEDEVREVIEGKREARKDKEETKAITEKEKERDRLAEKDSKKAELLPIFVPESEWLLIYCQIDAIPSSTRDTFLLNLFLISPTHSSILESFCSSLESGRVTHEWYETYPDEIEWKDRFNEVNEGRRVLAKAGMEVDYGSVMYWEELGEGREGVWDVALSEIGGWLMRDLPCPSGPDGGKSPEVNDSIGRQIDMKAYQEGGSKGDEPDYHCIPEAEIAQDHIKMMAFIIQTKTLSLVRQITRPDSASNSWPDRYRYKALTINGMVKLSVFLTRSPLPLRELLHDEIRSISAEIVILFDELEGAECEWVRVDDDLAWDLECVQRGLDDVGYGFLWEGVMTTWYRKSV